MKKSKGEDGEEEKKEKRSKVEEEEKKKKKTKQKKKRTQVWIICLASQLISTASNDDRMQCIEWTNFEVIMT